MRLAWVLIIGCILGVPGAARGGDVDSLTAEGQGIGPSAWVLAGTGAALGAETLLLHPRVQDVPREGFDPEHLWLGIDRSSVRPYSRNKHGASNWFLWSTVGYPSLERLVLGEEALRPFGVQAEAAALASLATFALKSAFSRPRPYTYLHAYERNGDGTPNWATHDPAFESLPSGHATLAWASSMSRVSLAALSYPHRSRTTHLVTGVIGGGLATAVSLLRVEAGAHFPTDVVAGSLVGGGIGLAVPLLHAGALAPESREALTWGLLGTLGGVVLGILATPPTSPFIR